MSDNQPSWRDVNRVELRGRLGRDAEVKNFGNFQVVNLRIATSEKWTDKRTQEKKELTEWHQVVVKFNDVAVNVACDLRKGQRVRAVGKIVTRKWTDSAGAERYATEVEVGRFGELELVPDDRDPPQRQPKPAGGGDLADEIPFSACKE